jgi:hypothetical protein
LNNNLLPTGTQKISTYDPSNAASLGLELGVRRRVDSEENKKKAEFTVRS